MPLQSLLMDDLSPEQRLVVEERIRDFRERWHAKLLDECVAHLPPLAIILSVLAGEQIAGIAGVFLSIPLVAIGTVLYRHVLEHSGRKGFFAGLLEAKEVVVEEVEVTEVPAKENKSIKEVL